MAGFEIKDGEYTKTIYSMIKEQRFVRRFAASDQITISFFFLFKIYRCYSSSVHDIRFSSNIESIFVSVSILLLLHTGKRPSIKYVNIRTISGFLDTSLPLVCNSSKISTASTFLFS